MHILSLGFVVLPERRIGIVLFFFIDWLQWNDMEDDYFEPQYVRAEIFVNTIF